MGTIKGRSQRTPRFNSLNLLIPISLDTNEVLTKHPFNSVEGVLPIICLLFHWSGTSLGSVEHWGVLGVSTVW